MSDLNFNYALLLPEIILAATGGIVLLSDAFRRELKLGRNMLPWITVAGAVLATLASVAQAGIVEDFAGIVLVDAFTTFFRMLFGLTLAVVVIGSHEYVAKQIRGQGEFYTMLLFATVGASFMAMSTELITAYVGIELLSFSL